MREIEERDDLFASNIFCIERRTFTSDHNGEKDFFAIARQRSDNRYRFYYLYANTMAEPSYMTHTTRDEAFDDLRKTINEVCL